jgi:hypothetical protein
MDEDVNTSDLLSMLSDYEGSLDNAEVNQLKQSLGKNNITVDDQLQSIINGNVPIDANTLDQINLLMLLEAKTTDDPLKKSQLKAYSNDIIDKFVSSVDLSDKKNSMLFGDSMYSGQIYSSDDELLSIDNAVSNSLPIYNMTQCESILKEIYGLDKNSTIIYVTSATNGILNENNSTSYRITAYDGVTKAKLDLSYCEEVSNSVEIPLSDTAGLNLTLYKEMKEQGIDIFNPDDPFFNDICISYSNNSTDSDATLNWRRQHFYPQKMPMCVGVNCTYQGISEFNYVKCDCTGINSGSDIVDQIGNVLLESLSEINIGIVSCYKQIPTVSKYIYTSLLWQLTLVYTLV